MKVLTDMPLYVSLGGAVYPGSTNIVIPPPITEPEYQPVSLRKFDWTKPRDVAVFWQAGLADNLPLRKEAFALLQKTPTIGGLPVQVHQIINRRNFTLSAQETWQKYRNSYFCPTIEGDLPFQKRFFDALISGCIPVVVAFPASDCNPHKSWFRKGWPGYNDTYPFSSSIDYSQFVVQLNSVNDMLPTLESLLVNKSKIYDMQMAIARVAPKLVYGLGNEMMSGGDAFYSLLSELERYLLHLRDNSSDTQTFGQFCPSCIWAHGTKQTCSTRVQYLVNSYRMSEATAIAATTREFSQCRSSSNCNQS